MPIIKNPEYSYGYIQRSINIRRVKKYCGGGGGNLEFPKMPKGREVKVVNGGKYALRDLVEWLKKSTFSGYIIQHLGVSESLMYIQKGEPAYVFNTSFNDGESSFVQMLEDSTLPDAAIEVHALSKEQIQDADQILSKLEESKVDPLYLNYDIDLVRLKISELEKIAVRQQKSSVPNPPAYEIQTHSNEHANDDSRQMINRGIIENDKKQVKKRSKNAKKIRMRVLKNGAKDEDRKAQPEIGMIEKSTNEKARNEKECESVKSIFEDLNFEREEGEENVENGIYLTNEKLFATETDMHNSRWGLDDFSEVCSVQAVSAQATSVQAIPNNSIPNSKEETKEGIINENAKDKSQNENKNENNIDYSNENKVLELAKLFGIDNEMAKEVISSIDDTILNDILSGTEAFEQAIEKQVGELKEKETIISTKEKMLNERLQNIEEKEKILLNKENELMLREKEIEEKKKEIDAKLARMGKKCEIEFKDDEVKEIQAEINKCFAELDEREKMLKESERVLELECAQVEGKIRALSELEKKLSDEKKLLEERRKEIEEKETILESRIEDFNSDLERVLAEQKEKERQLDEKWLKFLKEESNLKKGMAKVEEQTTYLKNEEKRLNDEKMAFEKERKKNLDEITKIKYELENEKKILEDSKRILDKKEKELREIENEYENKFKEIEKREKELAKIESSLAYNRASLDELALKLRKEEEKISKAWNDFRLESANFENSVTKKKVELDNIEKEIRAREISVEKRENECKAWESKCRAWDDELKIRKKRLEEEFRIFQERKRMCDENENRIGRRYSQGEELANYLLKLEKSHANEFQKISNVEVESRINNIDKKMNGNGKSAEIEELKILIMQMLESKKEKKNEPLRFERVTYTPKVPRLINRSDEEIKKLELTYPKELIDFYLRDEGSVMFIKGTQGTGRTIFSIQFVEDWSKPELCYYFTTRKNEDLVKRYSWIEDAQRRANTLFMHEDAISSMIKETDRLREKGERGVFIFNRFEKFCEKNKLEPSSFLEILRIEVAQKNKVAVICILEGLDPKLFDDLADGILLFKQHRRDNANEFLGQIELNELEGVDIKMNKYMYNLIGGRFSILKGVGYQTIK